MFETFLAVSFGWWGAYAWLYFSGRIGPPMKYRYKCPEFDCKFSVKASNTTGFDVIVRNHIRDHRVRN